MYCVAGTQDGTARTANLQDVDCTCGVVPTTIESKKGGVTQITLKMSKTSVETKTK